MKSLQNELAHVEKQFFLLECKKLSREQIKVETIQKKLLQETKALQQLEKKTQGALSKKAFSRVKQQIKDELARAKQLSMSLKAHEKQLKLHFVHDKQQLLRKEREKIALAKRGILVI